MYKLTNPHHRDTFGSMVEINAVDYINKLQDTVLHLQRQVSVLQGILERERESRQPSKNTRPSLRMATFMGRRSKDPEHKPEKFNKRAHRSKNNSNLSANNSNPSSGRASPGSSISEFKNPALAPRPPVPSANHTQPPALTSHRATPNDETQSASAPPHPPNHPDEREIQQRPAASPSHPTTNNNEHGPSQPSANASDSHVSAHGAADTAPASSPSPGGASEAEEHNTHSTETFSRTFQPRGPLQKDRNAAPMPSLEARKVRRGKAGRTKSFSAVSNDDIQIVSSCDFEQEKVSRAVSMHRESNAEPPTATPAPAPAPAARKSRGVPTVLKLFTRRSGA